MDKTSRIMDNRIYPYVGLNLRKRRICVICIPQKFVRIRYRICVMYAVKNKFMPMLLSRVNNKREGEYLTLNRPV